MLIAAGEVTVPSRAPHRQAQATYLPMWVKRKRKLSLKSALTRSGSRASSISASDAVERLALRVGKAASL